MRLWHKDLIPLLPRKQLLGQWRECCAIAKSIHEKGTPNHILVNRIMQYPINHFYTYASLVFDELIKRGYHADWIRVARDFPKYFIRAEDDLFVTWHDDRYLRQCFFNLQEKFDCGGITLDEFSKIYDFVRSKGVI